MGTLEAIRDMALLLALPFFAILLLLQPLGRIYAVGVAAYIAALFFCLNYTLERVDGPAGIGVLFYFLAVALIFVTAHGIKLVAAIVKWARSK